MSISDLEAAIKIEVATQTLRQVLEDNATLRADLAAARAKLREAQPLAAATLNAALRWNDHNYDNDTPNRWAREACDKAGFPRTPDGDDKAVAWLAAIDAALAGKP